ncbi:hypothetical protein GGR56DRAFT_654845, partial [Xylariaceae sp. FL0804]
FELGLHFLLLFLRASGVQPFLLFLGHGSLLYTTTRTSAATTPACGRTKVETALNITRYSRRRSIIGIRLARTLPTGRTTSPPGGP